MYKYIYIYIYIYICMYVYEKGMASPTYICIQQTPSTYSETFTYQF